MDAAVQFDGSALVDDALLHCVPLADLRLSERVVGLFVVVVNNSIHETVVALDVLIVNAGRCLHRLILLVLAAHHGFDRFEDAVERILVIVLGVLGSSLHIKVMGRQLLILIVGQGRSGAALESRTEAIAHW